MLVEAHIIEYHLAAFFAGFMLDLIFGDPHWLPHPVRAIGRIIRFIEAKLYGKGHNRLRGF